MRRHSTLVCRACIVLVMSLAGYLLAGCSAEWYRKSADREVYKILAQKRMAALNDPTPFTIERETWDPLEGLERRHQPLIPPSEDATPVEGDPPAIIPLEKCLEIAVRNSRDYQARKETVYLTALTLTGERNDYSPTLTGLLSGGYTRTPSDESWSADSSFGVTKLLSTGGKIGVRLTTDLLRYTTGTPRPLAASDLAFSLVQPLWRGAGQRVAQENLTQAERDVVYALRTFARYHTTFAVSIVNQYYGLLRQRAVVRNQWNNFQQLATASQRSAALAQAGIVPEFEVDQARQSALRARSRFIEVEQDYRSLLDNLKFTLALPSDAHIDVDERDLERLTAEGIVHPNIRLEDALRQAEDLRLDLMNSDDAVADAERKVAVARNGLGADITLTVNSNVPTDDRQPAQFRFDKTTTRAGLSVDLPLERTAARNTYRRTLIALDAARRSAQETRDRVKNEVRQDWRSLQEARESYEIQLMSLSLAERRVDSTTLLLEAGRVTTRDLLDAQADLLEAQNALASVLVTHLMARLQLWRDVGNLLVSPEGQLKGPQP